MLTVAASLRLAVVTTFVATSALMALSTGSTSALTKSVILTIFAATSFLVDVKGDHEAVASQNVFSN